MADQVLPFIQSLGVTKGLFSLFFLVMHWFVFSLYRGRIKHMQQEIDRLAIDNRAYRERFLEFIDRQMNLKRPKAKKGGK